VAGYTPIFDSVFQGSLCGKYPDLPVWLVLLALQQRGGLIDAHPSYIATISGIPQADIEAAIARFCQPDPSSRTPDHDGRRLEPIPDAGFGWRVLNHRKYQEKARLEAKNAREVAEGKNAERMKHRAPPQTAADRRSPPQTDPSNSNTNNKNLLGCSPEWEAIQAAYPKRHGSQRWPEALSAAKARLREGATWEELLDGVTRYAKFIRAEGKEHTPYVMQAASFFGKARGYAEPWSAPKKSDPFRGAV
jgi:hypothetical protein